MEALLGELSVAVGRSRLTKAPR